MESVGSSTHIVLIIGGLIAYLLLVCPDQSDFEKKICSSSGAKASAKLLQS